MPRPIRVAIAVLLGYLAMATLAPLTLRPAAMLVEIDRLRDPVTGVMSNWFIFAIEWPVLLFTSVAGGVLAAMAAGRAGRDLAIRALIIFVLVVGGVAAVLQATGVAIGDRSLQVDGELAGTSVEEAEAESMAARTGPADLPVQPIWDALLVPFLGALGVLLGGRTIARADAGLSGELDATGGIDERG